MHDTKLDQLKKVGVEVKASIANAKPVPSHKASTFPSPMSGLATIKQPGQATILQASAHCESKGGSLDGDRWIFLFLFFYFFGRDGYSFTSAPIATSRVCEVHRKP